MDACIYCRIDLYDKEAPSLEGASVCLLFLYFIQYAQIPEKAGEDIFIPDIFGGLEYHRQATAGSADGIQRFGCGNGIQQCFQLGRGGEFLTNNFQNLVPVGKNDLQPLTVLVGIVFSFFFFQSDHTFRTFAQKGAELLGPSGIIKLPGIAESFLSIRGDGLQLFVEFCSDQCTNGALDAVQVYGCPEFHRAHIQNMGDIMLHTGGRAGQTGIIHGNAADHQSFEHSLHSRRIPV